MDFLIFGVGLCVTLVVGTALTILIVQNNRVVDAEEGGEAAGAIPGSRSD